MTTFLLSFIDLLFTAFTLAILARVILSWFRFDPYHPISAFLHDITEPILGPLRRYIPPIGFFDISPIVAILLLQAVQFVLVQVLLGLTV
ncbi:MAG: YggT family protein [Chloroflexi bacterium]|nr:YggT family protein [Chloroflexota bacterium]